MPSPPPSYLPSPLYTHPHLHYHYARQRPCPKTCRNTSALERKYRSLNAYAVSTPGWLFRAPALTPTGTANPDPNPDRTGNVEAMQKELMAHGPIQVGFQVLQCREYIYNLIAVMRCCNYDSQVFSDFMTYKNGTYFRTPSAQGPRGGRSNLDSNSNPTSDKNSDLFCFETIPHRALT